MLGLRKRLAHRIQEINETTGENAAIVDPGNQPNTDAMNGTYRRAPGGDEDEMADPCSEAPVE